MWLDRGFEADRRGRAATAKGKDAAGTQENGWQVRSDRRFEGNRRGRDAAMGLKVAVGGGRKGRSKGKTENKIAGNKPAESPKL